MRTRQGHNPGTSRLAFTLIEMVTVIIVLAVAAGLVMPRLTSSDGRVEAQELDRVVEFLSAVSTRDSMAAQRVGVAYRDGVLEPLIAVPVQRVSAGGEIWRSRLDRDGLIRSVRFEKWELVGARYAGRWMNDKEWMVEFDGSTARYDLELVLVSVRTGEERTVVLRTGSLRAALLEDDQRGEQAIDLDASGRRLEAW